MCGRAGEYPCHPYCPRRLGLFALWVIEVVIVDESSYLQAETIRPPSPSTNDFVAMRSATKPSLRPIAQTFKLLCRRMDEDNPAAFRLPPDVVSYFAGVTDDGRGNYVDGEEARVKIE